MGRKQRHSARTGDGGGELRARKRQLQEAEREKDAAELTFFDDPSDKESESDAGAGSESEEEEQEMLELAEDDEDDESSGEEESGEDEDDAMDGFDAEEEKKKILKMDGKWGKSRKNFYSADTAEFELESDEEIAKDEEDAALELQRKQAGMVDDEDFGFDDQEEEDEGEEEEESAGDAEPMDDEDLVGEQLADIATLADDGEGGAAVEHVQRDFSKLSKKDKLQIVNQTAPELLGLMSELEKTMAALNDVVTPAILKLKLVRRRTNTYNKGLQYLVTRQNLLLNYSANISFYLLLRAEGKSVKDHPVLQQLLALKKQMNKMEALDESLDAQLQDLLTKEFPEEEPAPIDDGMDQFFGKTAASAKKAKRSTQAEVAVARTKKQKKSAGSSVSAAERAEAEQFYEEAARSQAALAQAKQAFYTYEKPELASSSEDSDAEDGKRGASYQIMKNKGLTAHKSKLNRNPRVKKRLQYRKAVIRRKGQVRDVRVGESGKYGGETTGIKSNLSRSRKIRN